MKFIVRRSAVNLYTFRAMWNNTAMDGKVRPIDGELQQEVCDATHTCISRAAEIFSIRLAHLPVLFDLGGRAAGMYRVRDGRRLIRYNPYLFSRYYHENLENTVPHEVAHYVTDVLFGLRNVRAHGREWATVMRALNAEPRATARFDLQGIPVRRQRRHPYCCDCRTYELTTVRHRRVSSGRASYICRGCGSVLRHDARKT